MPAVRKLSPDEVIAFEVLPDEEDEKTTTTGIYRYEIDESDLTYLAMLAFNQSVENDLFPIDDYVPQSLQEAIEVCTDWCISDFHIDMIDGKVYLVIQADEDE